jgi:peroxiredoxin
MGEQAGPALRHVATDRRGLQGPGDQVGRPLADLRGKVVILNFYTFGCGNCIHNYPAYKRWHEAYRGTDVVILGIHTPETAGERSIDAVRRKAAENGLAWPILVDNEQANWKAWSNNVWPSVYLIDKRGNIRSWWYGELNWQQARGEELMRGYIDRLLAESAATSQAATSPAGGR